MRKIKFGFTLAEILITLSIIGVIASMTIPSLVQDVQDAQFKTAWKKLYAELDGATKRVMQDNGASIKNVCDTSNCLRNLYKPYLNYIKSCDSGQGWGNCWYKDGKYKALNGAPVQTGDVPGFVLNNGNLILLWLSSESCSESFNSCAVIYTDVNGFKGPNIIGKDVFFIHLLKDRILPYGSQGDGAETTCIKDASGYGCGAKYLYQ